MKTLEKRVAVRSSIVSPLLIFLAILLTGSLLMSLHASPATPDTTVDLGRAQNITTALANALVAAVATISDASPPDATPADIEAGSEAVSLLFAECQEAYKLIDASGNPLDPANVPHGEFETDAMTKLVDGAPFIQEMVGGHLVTLLPLTHDMHPNCATCHTNYSNFLPGAVIGAAVIKVKP